MILCPLIFIISCASRPGPEVVGEKPYWFYNPSGEGYIGGVGVSGTHIKGKTGQRELAVSRAIEDIARQMGVKVASVMTKESETTGSSSRVTMSSYSIHTFSGLTVTAKIVEFWEDPQSGELYVYMRVYP